MPSYDKSLFTLQYVLGKGIAAFASRKIAAGTLLHSEKALIMIPDLEGDEWLSIANHQLGLLSATQKQEFFSLRNSYPKKGQIKGIVWTNSMPLGDGDNRSGVFPVCSRFNHACTRNADWEWNKNAQEEQIYAIRDIEVNEEITVNYVSHRVWALPGQERREHLRRKYGFDCLCKRCTVGQANGEELSDERRKGLGEIAKTLANGKGDLILTDPAKALSMCREAITLYEAEDEAGFRLERTYLIAFRICISHGDVPRATKFATLATECLKACQGTDAPGLEYYEKLVRSPETHHSAFQTKRWELGEEMSERDLQEASEEWLWRRARG